MVPGGQDGYPVLPLLLALVGTAEESLSLLSIVPQFPHESHSNNI